MPKQKAPALPSGVQKHLDDLAEAIEALAEGVAPREAAPMIENALRGATEAATEVARTRAAEKNLRDPSVEPPTRELGDLIAAHLKNLRGEAGWTQQDLADAMRHLGFPWRRITVAEVEGGSRKVSLEELLGLAALYGIPMFRLLLVPPYERVRLNDLRVVDSGDVGRLMLGEGGELGEGGAEWRHAAAVASVGSRRRGTASDWRPARELWANRRNSLGHAVLERARRPLIAPLDPDEDED